jgi:7,8-dihydropterin-6-yl-methyl-4-(beta-D-ribofuranosyl)aminobenzene 5'-phosphate synthase
LVTGPEKTILFDTGSDGALLLENMAKLQIDPGRIEIVVLARPRGSHRRVDDFSRRTTASASVCRRIFRLPGKSHADRATLIEVGSLRNLPMSIRPVFWAGRVREQALFVR